MAKKKSKKNCIRLLKKGDRIRFDWNDGRGNWFRRTGVVTSLMPPPATDGHRQKCVVAFRHQAAIIPAYEFGREFMYGDTIRNVRREAA